MASLLQTHPSMRRRAVLCAVLFSFAALANAQTANWKSYSYPADGFQASYPSVPEVQKKDVPTDAGSFEVHSYGAQVASVALFIVVCDYGSAATGKDPSLLLQGAKKAALESPVAHLVSEKKITLGSNPGLEFETETDTEHSTIRMYMAGSRLYEAIVVAPLGKPYPGAARFLDSFQLIAKTTE